MGGTEYLVRLGDDGATKYRTVAYDEASNWAAHYSATNWAGRSEIMTRNLGVIARFRDGVLVWSALDAARRLGWSSGVSGTQDPIELPTHALTHRLMSDSSGERLTPACICGWWSADGSHAAFERHIRAHHDLQR
jgi:hypothetical protein